MAIEFYKIAEKVDMLSQEYSPEKLEAIEKCFNIKGAEYYFFTEKLPKLEQPLPWLIPIKNRGYFSGDKNPPPQEVEGQPGFYTIPLWNVLPYLEKASQENKENPKAEITNALSEIIDSIISYRDENGKRIDNYRTDWFVTKIIFMLPYRMWNEGHIDFIRTAVTTTFGGSLIQSEIGKSVLPASIENKVVNLILKLLEVILGFTKVSQDNRDKIKPLMDKHWLRDALKKFNKDITELCGLEAAEIGLNTIKEALKEDEGEFSFVWIPTIEDSSQNKFPDKYECQLVFFVRDIFENSKPEKIRSTIEGLLKEEHNIFKRLAIHTINYHYDEFRDLFWNWNGNPLNERSCKHELYKLLKSRCHSFSKEQINKVLEWIESKDYGDYEEERKESALAYRKKEWFSALLETNDPDIISKYEEYDKREPTKLDHPGFLSWSESWSGVISPIQSDELLKKSSEEIAEYVKTWKEEDRWHGPSQDGLRDCLKQCVSENPDKFASDLTPFLDVNAAFQHDLLHGFREAWNAKKIFFLGGVLAFIERIIKSEEFWQREYGERDANGRNWLVSEIAEFIEAGTRNDEHAFDPKHLPQIEAILLTLADRAKSTVDEETGRLIDSVLNSPRGTVFSAVVIYCLRYARLFAKDKKERWPEKIKQDFTKRLDWNIERPVDFSVTLGKYLGNIAYLDRKWLFENIERIFPKEDEKHWKAAFGSYLSYSHQVYDEIYSVLRTNGHYTKGLETEFEDKYVTEKLVQHICIAFLEDWEEIGDPKSLIRRVLDIANIEQLSEVVSFLGRLEGDEPRKKLKERIKPLWKAMYELLKEKQEQPEYQGLISSLYLWLGLVDEIDNGIKEWSLLTAKYIRAQYHESGLVEELAKHIERTPAKVGEIYIEMLNAGTYPTYEEGDIRRIVEGLYEKGEKQYADTICNMYGEVGCYFLRDLYEKHND